MFQGRHICLPGLAGLLLSLLIAPAVRAQTCFDTPEFASKLAQIKAKPGTEVTRKTDNGRTTIQIRRAGVSVGLFCNGDEIQSVDSDNTGHGAVLCIWSVFVSARMTLNTCFPGQYQDLRTDLDDGIAAMNKFIEANSLLPTSADDVDKDTAAQEESLRKMGTRITPEQLRQECTSGDGAKMVIEMSKVPSSERKRIIAELLSVPRPPAMNPCM